MTLERVAVVDLADDLQVRKQTLFKILSRLGIVAIQRREPARGNQNVATVTLEEARAIRTELGKTTDSTSSETARPVRPESSLFDDVGYFYLIELEPAHDPGRFKVGFTTELDGRLQKHRCSAPFARYVKTWPCRRVWERTAIDCVTNGCERLHTEVFRSTSLSDIANRADAFFVMMPSLSSDFADSGDDPAQEPAG